MQSTARNKTKGKYPKRKQKAGAELWEKDFLAVQANAGFWNRGMEMGKSLIELRAENKELKRTLKVWQGIAERNMEDANASFLDYKKLLKKIKKIKKAKQASLVK